MCGARAVATSSSLCAQVIVGLSGSADSGMHLSAAAKGDQALLFLRRASLQAQRKSIDVVRTYKHLFICVLYNVHLPYRVHYSTNNSAPTSQCLIWVTLSIAHAHSHTSSSLLLLV